MADVLDDLERLALFEAWSERCVWCGRPLYFDEMEVEHLLPKSLVGQDNAKLFALYGLETEFDLYGLENLAPSCGPCNQGKGRRPPVGVPIVANLLRSAREKAPGVREAADRSRSSRRIRQAITILRAGAQSGDQEALAALRAAGEELSLEFADLTGGTLTRLHSAIANLAMTGPIRQSDAQFFYPQARHETGGPAPSETVGSVLSYSETFGSITSRIDFVPRDKEALERYGPIIEFAAAPGEAGLRATAALQKALKEGRSIEIREGIDVTFRRMPPAYDDLVGNPIAGPTITIGPAQGVPARRQIPDWDAELRVCSPTDRIGHAFRLVLQELEKVPAGWDDAISGTRGGLTVTALFRHDESNGAIRWEFTHVLDESPIAEQLLAVEFLNAVQASNEFVVLDRGTTGRPDFRVRRTAQAITPESRALTALLSDLSVLEQFADTRFALPAAIDPEDVRDIARTASLVRNKGSEATWSSARLTIPAGSLRRLSAGGVMVVDATASVTIFGKTIELGRIRRTLSSYRVASVEPSSDEAGQLNVQIKPLDAASDRIFETLEPQSRVRRPPPLPPKKAARSRGAKKRRRSR